MLFIQKMPNMSNNRLSSHQRQFVDELASLLTPWGLPIAAARLYGYLQLQNEPVSLDEIAADLDISKSSACTAARILESHGNARRLGVRGTKRVLYIAGADPGTPLRQQTELLGRMSVLIASRKDAVAKGAARERLRRLSEFHADLKQAMQMAISSDRQKSFGEKSRPHLLHGKPGSRANSR